MDDVLTGGFRNANCGDSQASFQGEFDSPPFPPRAKWTQALTQCI